MSVKEDKVNLIITINGDKARKELIGLDSEAVNLRTSMKGLKKDSAEYIAKAEELKTIEGRMRELRAEIGLNGKTMRELNQELRALNMVRNNLVPGTQAFKENEVAIRRVKERMSELNDGIKINNGLWSQIGKEVKTFGLIAGSYLGFEFLSSQISNIVSKAGKLSDQLADVAKTTGMSSDEVIILNSELSKIDTRTSTTALRDIAVVAGQLGTANKDVLGFVQSIEQATVALGDEFTGGAAQVADELGKLRNVFSDVKSSNVQDDLLKIGNALNVLGAAGAATGPVVADFSNRIGGVGIPLGLTSAQVLGLSATLQELNVSTERGGTAVTKILQKMARDTDEFAKVAGIPAKEFADLVNKDLYGAFIKVLDGSNKTGTGATQLASILQDLGVDGSGASEVISKLGGNTEKLAEKVLLAGTAIRNTDSILNEYRIKNETLGAQIDKLGKSFFSFATSPGITNFLTNQVKNANDFIDSLKNLPEWYERNKQALRFLTEVTIGYYIAVNSARISTIAKSAADLVQQGLDKTGAVLTSIKTGATAAYGLAVDVVTGKVTLASAAQQVWNRVLMMNPFLAVFGSLVALVELIDLYRKNTSEAVKLEKDKVALSRELDKVQKDLSKSYDEFRVLLENINKLTPIERAELEKNIAAKIKDAEATLKQVEATQESIRLKSSEASTLQMLGNYFLNYGNAAAASSAGAIQGFENGKEAAAKYDDRIKSLKESISGLKDESKTLSNIQNAYSNAMSINAVTAEQYNEKLRLLRVALGNAVIGSDEYLKISSEIANVQNKLASASGPTIDTKSIEEATKKFADLQVQIKKLEEDVLIEQQGRHEQEVAQVNLKYEKLIDAAVGHNAEIARLKNLQNTELTTLETEQNAIIEGLRDQLYFSRLSKDEQEIQSIRNKYQSQIDDFIGFNDKIKEIEAIRDEEIEAKRVEQSAKKLADKQSLEDQIFTITSSAKDQEINAEATKWDALITAADQYGLDSTKLTELKITAIQALIDKQNDREIKSNDAKNKKILDADRKRWDVTLKLTQDFTNGFGALLQIFGAKQSTMLEFQKMVTLTQIAIDTASAISSVIKAASMVGVTPIDRAIMIAAGISQVLVGIGSAIAIMNKVDTPAAPQFNEGGKLPGGSVMPGPKVNDDNLHVVDPASGRVVATVKSGEPVLSTETYENNKPVVDALLDSSMNKGGAKIQVPAFELGGIVDRPLMTPVPANTELLNKAALVSNYGPSALKIVRDQINGNTGESDGRAIVNNATSRSAAGSAASEESDGRAIVNQAIQRMIDANKEMLDSFKEELKNIEVKGVWDYDYFTRTQNRIAKIEDDSKVA